MLNLAETSTILAALRFYQQKGLGDPVNRPLDIHEIAEAGGECITLDDDAIDELCEKINCGRWFDITSGAILLAVNTEHLGEINNVGSAIPPEDADPENNYGVDELWAEWRDLNEEPESDSMFVEWLVEEKGWERLGCVDAVTINL